MGDEMRDVEGTIEVRDVEGRVLALIRVGPMVGEVLPKMNVNWAGTGHLFHRRQAESLLRQALRASETLYKGGEGW